MDPSRLINIKLFQGLSQDELDHVAKWATEVSYAAGSDIMREDTYSYDLLAISEGTAEVRRADTVLAQMGAGDTVGEVGLLRGSLRSATVTATSPLMLVRISSWDMHRLDDLAPHAADAIRRLAAEREHLSAWIDESAGQPV
jgi:CRP-like cAMP-binding protein